MLKKVRRIHGDCRGGYGSPRVHQALRHEGVRIGRKRVERLLREASLVGRVAKLYRRVPGVERFYQRHKNLRLNMPAPTGVNQQWVADLTYIKVNRQWQYLAVVLDVYSRPKHCTDNAHMESFLHSMKAEVIHGVSFKDEQELRAVLRGYTNQFYNQKRLHSGISYVAPAEYERMAA